MTQPRRASQATPLLPDFLDEAFDAVAGLDDLVVSGRETGADVAGAARAEGRAGDDGDFFLLKQADGELVFREAGGGDVGERVERAARQMAREAGGVEAAHDEVAAAVVLLAHAADVVPAVLQGFERAFLRDDGGAHHRILVDFHHRVDERRGAAGVADAPAGHRKGLREAVQEDRAFGHARQAGDAGVRALEGELGVDFVAEDEEVFLAGEGGDGFELLGARRR